MKQYNVKDLTDEDIQEAKRNLNSDDHLMIEDLSKQLRARMREKAKSKSVKKKSSFGKKSADELLAKLGIFFVERNITEIGK
jgi:hypothetical protein